jgi:hypothetical protein
MKVNIYMHGRGSRGHDRIVDRFTTTYALYYYYHCDFKSIYGEVLSIQHYVIKFVNALRQVGGIRWVSSVFPTNKTDCHDIADILLKVVFNTIILPSPTFT